MENTSKRTSAVKKILLVSGLIFLGTAGYVYRAEIQKCVQSRISQPEPGMVLYGNVDDRQIHASFLVPERIQEILVEEGTLVKKGDLLATLETTRLEQSLAAAEAQRDQMKASLEKAKNGYLPEELAMADAGLKLAQAKINFRKNSYERMKRLVEKKAVSEQEYDSAEAEYRFVLAEEALAQANHDKIHRGTRPEDIAAAEAALAAAETQCKIMRQRLEDTKLYAPCDGIVRNRVQEPGEMASPQSTVLILAVTSPKWVRIYLPETLLTTVKQGSDVQVSFDGMEESLDGWVGFISPNAEFTPKNIETPELRPSLVYEARVYIEDPEGRVKLGAPATVRLKP